jgi:nucleoside-diphosphate-sugar epimerase
LTSGAPLSQLQGSRVLVTGGAGFIGSEVVRQLSLIGSIVTVLDNFSSGRLEYIRPFLNKRVTIVKGDIRNADTVSKAVKEQDYVYHLAALPFIPDSYSKPRDFFETNVTGTLNLLIESAKTRTVSSFVTVSTSEVYGSALYSPMNEMHPTQPHSTYAVSKLAADRITFTFHKENGFPATIVRPFNSYGPNVTQPYIVPEIITQVLKGMNPIHLGNSSARRDFTFVSDTSMGIILAGTRKEAIGETINVGSGQEVSVADLARIISELAKGKPIPVVVDKKRFRPFDVQRLNCDNAKARRLLHWKPKVPLRKGLAETIDWFMKHRVTFRGPFVNWYELRKNDDT